MQFNFPAIQTVRKNTEQANKIRDEVEEFFRENLCDKEAVDILHAVETFIRVHFKGRNDELDRLINVTIEKNKKRGYYDKPCF